MGVVIRQGIKASFSNYIGVGLGVLSTFVLYPLFFNPEELGIFRLILELTGAIYAFALLGVNISINRYFPHFKNAQNNNNGFYFWVLITPFLGFLCVSLSLTIWGDSFYSLFKTNASYLERFNSILLVLIFCNLFQTVMETISSNFGRIARPVFVREVFIRIGIIISSFCFYLGICSFIQMMWMIGLVCIIALLINFYFLNQITRINLRPDFNFYKKNEELFADIRRNTLFLIFNGVAGLFINKLDFFIIGATLGMAETAVYSIGFYIATFIEIPKRSILQIATPIISKHVNSSNNAELSVLFKKASLNQFLVSILLFLLIWINIDTTFLYMPKGDFYSQGKTVILVIALSRLVEMIGSPASPILSTSKYYRYTFFNIVIAVFSALVSNLILIPNYGILGGAFAAVITAFSNYGLAVLIVWAKFGITPFSSGILKVLLICAPGITLASIGKWADMPIWDSIIKTISIMPLTLFLLIKIKVSDDFENVILRFLDRLKLYVKN